MYKLMVCSILLLSYACGQQPNIDQATIFQLSAQAECSDVDVTSLPEKAYIEVPYVEQEPGHCGPASLSMVMGYYGTDADQQSIGYGIVTEQGTTIRDLTARAKDYGFETFAGTCQLSGLLRLIAEGRPVITRVLWSDGTNGHLVVVTGYDNSLGVIYVNDPANPDRLSLTFDEFTALWNITNLDDKNENSENLVIILSPILQNDTSRSTTSQYF